MKVQNNSNKVYDAVNKRYTELNIKSRLETVSLKKRFKDVRALSGS